MVFLSLWNGSTSLLSLGNREAENHQLQIGSARCSGTHDILPVKLSDHQIDDELRGLRDHNDIVIDSRLGFYWIPESFKVYLDLDSDVAIARIFKDANLNTLRSESGEGSTTMTDVMDQVEERMQSERRRFKKLYGINPYSIEHFDLVIDTARHSPQTVALTVFDTYRQWLTSSSWKQVISRVPASSGIGVANLTWWHRNLSSLNAARVMPLPQAKGSTR